MDIHAVAIYNGNGESSVAIIENPEVLKNLINTLDPDDFKHTKIYENNRIETNSDALTDLISDYVVSYVEDGIEEYFINVSGLFVRREILEHPHREFKFFIKADLF